MDLSNAVFEGWSFLAYWEVVFCNYDCKRVASCNNIWAKGAQFIFTNTCRGLLTKKKKKSHIFTIVSGAGAPIKCLVSHARTCRGPCQRTVQFLQLKHSVACWDPLKLSTGWSAICFVIFYKASLPRRPWKYLIGSWTTDAWGRMALHLGTGGIVFLLCHAVMKGHNFQTIKWCRFFRWLKVIDSVGKSKTLGDLNVT